MIDTKGKAQAAQEILLEAILEFLKSDPDNFFGAKKISDRLGLMEGHKFYFVHNLLLELKKRGEAEQSDNRQGFKYKKRTTHG